MEVFKMFYKSLKKIAVLAVIVFSLFVPQSCFARNVHHNYNHDYNHNMVQIQGNAPMQTPESNAGGQAANSSGEQVANSSGGQAANPSGGQAANSSGEQAANPSGEQVANPSGGQAANPSGGQVENAQNQNQQNVDEGNKDTQKTNNDSNKENNIAVSESQTDSSKDLTQSTESYGSEIAAPIFSFDTTSGIISFVILIVLLVAIIVLLVVILVKMGDKADYFEIEELKEKVEKNQINISRWQNSIEDALNRNSKRLENVKRENENRFDNFSRDLSRFSSNSAKRQKADRREESSRQRVSEPAKNLSINEQYNLYLNGGFELPKEFSEMCIFSEYAKNQLEKNSGQVFYILKCGNGTYEVYPAKSFVLDDTRRSRYLNVSFFDIVQGSENRVEPCVLKENMYGKYDVVSKGRVIFR